MNSQNDEGCGNLEMGKYAPVWMSGARQNDESDILNELSPNPKIHQTSICQARERPNASKSIFRKREHSNDYTSTNLTKTCPSEDCQR